jgi:asparagine synthase (glutamine-hydrolysing)
MPARLNTYGYLDQLGPTAILEQAFLQRVRPAQTLQTMREVYSGIKAQNIINKMSGLDLKFTLADNDLQKVGRMSELAGVQVGYPFLQSAMVEFAAKLPADLKVRRLAIRYFFKQALRDYLPKEIIHKQKHGFGLPFGDWLVSHNGLRSMAFDSLEALKKRRIVKADFLDDLRDHKLMEHANYYGGLIWLLMILERSMDGSSDSW